MRLLKILYISGWSLLLFAACKKDKDSGTPTPTNPETCIQSVGTENGNIIPGQYIIAYNSSKIAARGVTIDNLESFSESTLSRNQISKSALRSSFEGKPGGFVCNLSPAELGRIRNDPDVAAVEEDRIVSLGNCFTVAAPRLITWNVSRVGYGDGTGKTAWIIDSGIDFDHPDLNVDQSRSKSFLNGNSSATDGNGHGTHIAGIIGAKNNTFGVLGVASGATLVSLRVLDADGKGVLSAIVQAVAYVNSHGRAGDVVNLSVGDEEGTSNILDEQVQNTASRGIFFAIAAGNEHTNADLSSPARVNGPNIYTVSAIDSLDNFASFSNFGNDAVDYAMPGVRILSTYIGNRYAYMSGTSMAAPHLAGLLLLKGNSLKTSGLAKNDPDGTPDPIAHF